MSIEQLKKVAEDVVESKRKLAAFAQEQGKEVIASAFLGLFEKYPELGVVTWDQYTPYFNDGEECVFSVHDPCLIPAADLDEDKWEYQFYNGKLRGPKADTIPTAALDAFDELWGALPEEILKEVFGDHVTITVTKGEVAVTECGHD